MDANFKKEDNGEVEEVDFVNIVNFLETADYVAEESVKDAAIGDNLSHMQITGITKETLDYLFSWHCLINFSLLV